MRKVIINMVLGGAWGFLLGSLGADFSAGRFYIGMGLLAAIIINSMVE